MKLGRFFNSASVSSPENLTEPPVSDKEDLTEPSISDKGTSTDSTDYSRAKTNLKEFLTQNDYKAAYRSIKNSGNAASDEGIALFLLKSNEYKDCNKLTPLDLKWVAAELTGNSYKNLGTVSKAKSLNSSKEQRLTQRIIQAYTKTYKNNFGAEDNMWLEYFFKIKLPIHKTIVDNNEKELTYLLNNPDHSKLFHGFDASCGTLTSDKITHTFLVDDPVEICAVQVLGLLQKLAAIIGIRRLINPEFSATEHLVNVMSITVESAEQILSALDAEFGFKIDFPNPYPQEAGLATSRGIASFRSIQALYQAWKCAQLIKNRPNSRVLEIGAGLGRAAYYSYRFGLTNYTIVDIPLTNVAQAHFLANTLGHDSVILSGEEKAAKGIEIITPPELFAKDRQFDLVVNFDSLTEMTETVAYDYWRYIERNSPIFLSVNHEANPHTVRDLYTSSKTNKEVMRSPYLLRDGYMEEVIKLRNARDSLSPYTSAVEITKVAS